MQVEPVQTDQNTMPAEVSSPSGTRVLIHLGAGSCPGLQDYLNHYDRVVLVDADSAAVDSLQSITAGEPRVRVLQAAVAAEVSSGFLYEYNLPEATSIHPATGLLELYPGLRLVNKTPVELEGVERVLAAIEIDTNASNAIVIDLSGEEFPVLYTLAQRGVLGQFEEILVHGGRTPLYEGAMPLPEVADWLKDEGFDLREQDDSADPDKPCARFRRNRLVWLNRGLQARVDYLLAECEARQAQIEQANSVKDAIHKLAVGRQTQIDEIGHAKAQAEQLAAEREAQIAEIAHAKAQAEQLAAERHTQIQQIGQAKAQAEQVAAEREAQIAEIAHAKAQAEQLAAERQTQIEQIAHAKAQAEQLAAERHTQIDEIGQAKAQAEQLAAERHTQIQQIGQAKAQAEQVAAERQTQIDEIGHAKAQAEQLAAERQAQIAEIGHAKAQAEQVAAERHTQIEQIGHAKAQAEQLAAERQAQIDEIGHAKAQAEQLAAERQTQIDQLSNDLRECRQSQALALKLQFLRETDLKDLQFKYREVANEHNQQRELLGKLAERLVVANQYFQQLTATTERDASESADIEDITGRLSEELAPDRQSTKRPRRRRSP